MKNRIAAVAVIPYPPGIPMVMAGERFTDDQLDYLRSMEEFSAKFPGFELEIQGVDKVDEQFYIYCFKEEEKEEANGTAAATKGKKRRGEDDEASDSTGGKKGKGSG